MTHLDEIVDADFAGEVSKRFKCLFWKVVVALADVGTYHYVTEAITFRYQFVKQHALTRYGNKESRDQRAVYN
jgi:hypothetical protein